MRQIFYREKFFKFSDKQYFTEYSWHVGASFTRKLLFVQFRVRPFWVNKWNKKNYQCNLQCSFQFQAKCDDAWKNWLYVLLLMYIYLISFFQCIFEVVCRGVQGFEICGGKSMEVREMSLIFWVIKVIFWVNYPSVL